MNTKKLVYESLPVTSRETCMDKLKLSLVKPNIESSSFDCGVKSINSYVKLSYYPLLLQQAYTFEVTLDGRVLGYYQILFREIELSYFPEEISEYKCEEKENTLSAVHVRFIAVDKKYQRNGIGTTILQIIIKQIRSLSNLWPIRIITIDAILPLVEWYKKMDFRIMAGNTPGQDGVSVAMFFDCLRFSQELEDYSNSLV